MFSCLLANMAVGTRMAYSLARDGMLPGSGALSRVSPRTRTPVYCVVLVALVAFGVNLLSAGIATRVVAITSICYYATYVLTVIAALIADRRGRMPDTVPGGFDLGRWLKPVAVTGVLYGIVIIIDMTVPSVNNIAAEICDRRRGARAAVVDPLPAPAPERRDGRRGARVGRASTRCAGRAGAGSRVGVTVRPAGIPGDVELRLVKAPRCSPAPARDEAVSAKVSEMLLRIERDGMDAVRTYSRELDGWAPDDFRVADSEIAAATASLSDDLKAAIASAQEQVRRFAELQRRSLVDFETETLPGVRLGQRQVPVARVGAYIPAGRVPMLASAFMTVLVAKAAGVERVVACSPARGNAGIHPPVLHAIATSGADAIFTIGGVQALAAMAFGLIDTGPADVLVGPGNAFVAEAKRQLFGRVGIDLLAGPSEITVLSDDTADPELVAADLLAQTEHGATSPAILVTTSGTHAEAVVAEIARQLDGLAELGGDEICRRAWEDHGAAVVVGSAEDAVRVVDGIAPEHLEVQTDRDYWYFDRVRNYGSAFLGARATVAFSDKAIGTNHTLPTGQAARYTGGLSVAKFLKTLTFQRIVSDEGVAAIAPVVAEISRADLMPAHEATANLRIARWVAEEVS